MTRELTEWFLWPENQPNNFRSPWVPYWVDRLKFEQFWSQDGSYLPPGKNSYLQAPYFGTLKGDNCFFLGRAYFDEFEKKIHFSNGMHRSRWYIDTMKPILIPLGLPEKSYQAGRDCGLIIREIEPFESIDLPVSWEDIEAERQSYNG